MDLAKEYGASFWLLVFPLSDLGFHLHKGEFRDTHDYVMAGPILTQPRLFYKLCHLSHGDLGEGGGGGSTIRHNEIRDMTAYLLIGFQCGN